jgi:hypothetical protein
MILAGGRLADSGREYIRIVDLSALMSVYKLPLRAVIVRGACYTGGVVSQLTSKPIGRQERERPHDISSYHQ